MRFIKFTSFLCLLSLFFIFSVTTNTFVSDDEYSSANKKINAYLSDFDDNPDIAPEPQAYTCLFVEVFAVGLFDFLQKVILNVKRTLYILGPPIF